MEGLVFKRIINSIKEQIEYLVWRNEHDETKEAINDFEKVMSPVQREFIERYYHSLGEIEIFQGVIKLLTNEITEEGSKNVKVCKKNNTKKDLGDPQKK